MAVPIYASACSMWASLVSASLPAFIIVLLTIAFLTGVRGFLVILICIPWWHPRWPSDIEYFCIIVGYAYILLKELSIQALAQFEIWLFNFLLLNWTPHIFWILMPGQMNSMQIFSFILEVVSHPVVSLAIKKLFSLMQSHLLILLLFFGLCFGGHIQNISA